MRRRSLESTLSILVLASAWLVPLALAQQTDWTADPEVRQRLSEREVVVQSAAAVDPGHPQGRVRAAVLIRARPEVVWAVMTDCQQLVQFVPGLEQCRRVDGSADGRWEDFEQVVRYSWFLPAVRYVFRADYDRPQRVDFHRISGDLKEEQGRWLLTPTADGAATVVEHEMYVDPGFWIPQWLVSRALRKDVPAALAGLRERVERPP